MSTSAEPASPPAQVAERPAPLPSGGAPLRRRTRRGLRFLLMISLPLLLAAGGAYVYVTGGRDVGTDDAYIQQDLVSVIPQVSGRIVEVGAHENEVVARGSLLFAIDDAAYRNNVEQAEAAVASARLDVEKLKAAYAKAVAKRKTSEDAVEIAKAQQKRQSDLAGHGIVAQAALDQANLTLQNAAGDLVSSDQDIASARAALGGDPDIMTDAHPEVMVALAKLHSAELDLSRTKVYAPVDGVVTLTNLLQKGQYVAPGSSVLALVETSSTHIEANYKESDLTHMAVGQPAKVTVDAYPDVTLKGRVESIGAGTGSAFSLIPAQNASGNWVKVVQRLPVRIALDDPKGAPPLRVGLSVAVDVDTGHARGLPKFVVAAAERLGLQRLLDAARPPRGYAEVRR
ncbi:HlyD family secretion protein [Consotaella salsifontis]|uniref:Membrane fusion protein, multidrug efflux system n=1 Tax=Consotaella salsifontis TaxID=1365950 RepID=A0A1T4QWP7_9HYPH|nr:HlyD family secretion protein [Consotaella salsifontis]SKA08210.1 membrane fusion protein, multidrug efflux system [Consotaella salsifontis]